MGPGTWNNARLTFARYVLGVAAMLLSIASVARGARAVRARLLPDADDALAGLAVVVLTIACITVVSEALGTVGWFRAAPLAIALTLLGVGAARIAPAASAPLRRPLAAPDASARATKPVAIVALLVVVGEWLTATARALHVGVTALDSTWYHLPTAARFAQSGSTWHLHVIDTTSLTVFYPAGSEVIHAVGMVFLGTDALSRTLNIGWLLLGLLAAWCIGARWGVAPITVSATALVFATPQLVHVDAGQALNDMAVVALVLAAVAVVVNGAQPARGRWLTRGSLVVAGVAAGLAAGTKWTALAPAAALTIGVPFLVRPGERTRGFAVWATAALAGGGYWYARDLVHVGSPIPPIRIGIGSLHFPEAPPGVPTFSVARYLTDSTVWRFQFHPGLRADFGPAWWIVLALAAAGLLAGFAAGFLRGRDRTLCVVPFVGGAGLIGYLVAQQAFDITQWPATPRYAAPAVALGLIALALALSRLSNGARLLALATFAGTLLATQLDAQLWKAWWRVGGIKVFLVGMVGTGVLAIAGAIATSPARAKLFEGTARTTVILALAATSLVGGVALDHYQPAYSGRHLPVLAAARLLHKRRVTHSRIALTGTIFTSGSQYYFYDKRLTNVVQFIGQPGPHHSVGQFRSCDAFIGAIATGRYRYVVAETAIGPDNPVRWLGSDPAAREIFRDPRGRIALFAITDTHEPTGCKR